MIKDEALFEKHGWEVECESPLEIRTENGCFASGEAAKIVLEYLKGLEAENQIERRLENLNVRLDSWISSSEKIAVNFRKRGLSNEARNYDGQATAFWAVKIFLVENNLID